MPEGINKPQTDKVPDPYLAEFVEEFDIEKHGKVRLESYPENHWAIVTLHFPEALITISKEAQKLSREERKELIQALKKYRDDVRAGNKSESIGMGMEGSVFRLGETNFAIKETTGIDRLATAHAHRLQQVIDNDPNFPKNIRILQSLAIAEPVYSFPFKTDTMVVKNKLSIRTYNIMPLLNKTEELHIFANRNGVSADATINYISNAFYNSPHNEFKVSMIDKTYRNILVSMELNPESGEKEPIYWLIDH
jgi:hypothetical protein